MGPRALQEEKQEAARRELYNKDAEGPGGPRCYITCNWESGGREGAHRAGDGQAGDPPDKELGHLEVRE